VVEEVSDEAEVRQSSSSLLSAAASFRRPALTAAVLGAAAVIVVVARHTLAKSLHVLAAASPGWLLLALAAEAVSLTAFGMSRTLLLRVNGHRIGLGPVMAITYAAHALGLSIPFAGAELDVVYSYRQFRRAGLDAATTSWSMAVSWICSTASLALLLVAGAIAGSTSAASAAGYAGAAVYLLPVAGVLLALRFDRMRALLQSVPGAAVASTGLTPGGFALVELAMTAALTASGLHSSAALAAVVAYRFISFWLVLLGGWVAFIVLAHPLRRRRGR
jgi:uncharacterized membrane protein YbhN (UPF0104 family)